MALSRKSSSSAKDKQPAAAWLNVSLTTSDGKEYRMPIGIPLNSDNESGIIQALLNQGKHGQEFVGKLVLSFVGDSKTNDSITL
jgi:hypothetical protein